MINTTTFDNEKEESCGFHKQAKGFANKQAEGFAMRTRIGKVVFIDTDDESQIPTSVIADAEVVIANGFWVIKNAFGPVGTIEGFTEEES